MLPLFTYPLAFAGLAAVPVLVAIYLLRNRYRRRPVSSLMLWEDPRHSAEGGTRIRARLDPAGAALSQTCIRQPDRLLRDRQLHFGNVAPVCTIVPSGRRTATA